MAESTKALSEEQIDQLRRGIDTEIDGGDDELFMLGLLTRRWSQKRTTSTLGEILVRTIDQALATQTPEGSAS